MIVRRLLPFFLATLLFSACSDPEDCTLGSGDEDADGLSNCQDPDCSSLDFCAAEICDNNVDDNGNGAVDCQESSCSNEIKCLPETNCTDGTDNNQNGDTDCADDDCSVDEACIEVGECTDGDDNDGDGDADCDDSDCSTDPICFPEDDCGTGHTVCCSDGIDNNNDGNIDCADPACSAGAPCQVCGNGDLEAPEVCDDGNNSSGDCCASDCTQTTCQAEVEPNANSTQATGPLDIPSSIAGSIAPQGNDADFYSFNLTLAGKIRFETSDGSGLGNCTNSDTFISIFNTNGTSSLGSDGNSSPAGLCSLFTTAVLQPGIYFVKVTSEVSTQIPIYQLHATGLICGNGTLDAGTTEECDNGLNCEDLTPCTSDAECVGHGIVDELCKLRNGDGCDTVCSREPVCGDTLLDAPPELCDDGGVCADGTTICNITNPAVCVGIGDEQCVLLSGDGCDANCKPTGCPNGFIAGVEECDDGNNINTDNCTNTCTNAVCGDNIVQIGTEECDGTALNGASCVTLGFASGTLLCAQDCTQNDTGCVNSICGNGVTETGEECDDGNPVDGDSCSSACLFEITLETEPNNTSVEATGPFTAPFLAEGGLTPATEFDFFAFTLSSFGALRIETFDGNGPTSCTGVDTKVDLIGLDGTTSLANNDNVSGTNKCSKIDPVTVAAARNLPPGTYFIKVAKGPAAGATAAAYRLQVNLSALCGNNVAEVGELCDGGNIVVGDGCDNQCRTEACGNGRLDAGEQCEDSKQCANGNTCTTDANCATSTGGDTLCLPRGGDCCSATCQVESDCVIESEPNNTALQANGPVPNGSKGAGSIAAATDLDVYSIVIPNRVDLKVETQNLNNTACNGSQDTLLKLFNVDGTTVLASNNDISTTTPINRCSRLDPTATAALRGLTAGTYFVQVEKGGTATTVPNYRMIVTFVALCGDGSKDGSEACDDGNQVGGDGCENNCILTPACGNLLAEGNEECDDGKKCSDGTTACTLDAQCAGIGDNVCLARSGDGCDSLCQREPVCGDLFIDAPETCDDGKQCANGTSCTDNTNCTGVAGDTLCLLRDLDCCSATCQIEPGCIAEVEPNNTSLIASGPITGGQKAFGGINPIADVDFYALTIPAEANLKLETTNGTTAVCNNNQDTLLKFIAASGATISSNNDIGGNPVNRCSRVDSVATAQLRNLAPGNYFISVERSGNNSVIARYNLVVTFNSLCGNGGAPEADEACDDGNLTNGDGCEANCTITPACGNLLVEGTEACDDGKKCSDGTTACTLDAQCAGIGDNVCVARSGDGCDATCKDESCGDSITNDTNETCDDGNTVNTDSCLNTCRLAACGDNVVFVGTEQCDNGGNNSDTAPNACRTDCSFPSCGDGAVDTGELCDDGNNDSGDGCDATCDIEFCGDGIANNGTNEECDDSNASNNDSCTTTCTVAACGDGFTFNTDGGEEQCDDANAILGDGCDEFCFVEQTDEIEPNDTIAEAQVTGINITVDQVLLGAIPVIGDGDFYQITLATPGVIELETFDDIFGSCVSINTVIEVFNPNGTKRTTFNNGGIGLCDKGQTPLPAGTFFIKVTDFNNNNTIPAYSLFINFL